MRLAGRLLDALIVAATLLGAAAVILMMLQIVADVVLKNVLNWPLPLTSIFVANYYMVLAAFMPLALAEKLNRHISVELVFLRLSRRWRRWVGGVVCLTGAVVCAGVAWQLWGEAMKKFHSGTLIVEQSISVPTWPGYFALPVGFGLMGLVLVYRTLVALGGLAGGLGEAPIEGDAPVEQV